MNLELLARKVAMNWLVLGAQFCVALSGTFMAIGEEVKPKKPPRSKKLEPPAWLQEAAEVRDGAR